MNGMIAYRFKETGSDNFQMPWTIEYLGLTRWLFKIKMEIKHLSVSLGRMQTARVEIISFSF